MVVRTVGAAKTAGVSATTDRWLPLSIKWDVIRLDGPLYLFIKDPTYGFVELKVNPDTGALVGFVVIDPPHEDDQKAYPARCSLQGGNPPIIERHLWPWIMTPDYKNIE